MSEVSPVTCMWLILHSSPSEGTGTIHVFWTVPSRNGYKKVNKLHYISYEKFYEALKDPLKLIAHVLHTRKPDNIKFISMVVRLPATQQQN